jgi:GT2 family glycosyltransferase
MDTAELDVVIVTFDTREVTLSCLDRLAGAPRTRAIVVDNGSTDGTAAAIAAAHPAARVVRLETGVGFAEACNRGAAVGAAPLVLFLNSDVLARPGALDALVGALRSDPAAVAAGGRLVDPGTDDTQPAYAPQRYPGLGTLLARVTGLEVLLPATVGGPDPALLAERGTIACDQPAGACFLVRREVFDAVGRFDEHFWFWYEDVDLARRLSARGRLLHVGGAVFEHLGGGTFAGWGRERGLRSRLHGIVRYAAVHLPRREQVVLGGALALSGAARALAFRVLGRRGLATAWADGARAGLALAAGRPAGPARPGAGA